MGFIWGLLTSKLSGPIATAAALLFLALFVDAKIDAAFTIKDLRGDLATVTAERDQAKTDLTQCRANNGTLQAGIVRQGDEVIRLGAEGRARTEAAQRELDAARRASTTANRHADRVLATPVGADQCVSADAVIMGSVQ